MKDDKINKLTEITIEVSNKSEEDIDIFTAELIDLGFRPEIIDYEWNKQFLIENVNKGEGYADYVSEELLNPVNSGVYLRFYSDNEKLKRFEENFDIKNLPVNKKDITNWDFENEWKKHFKPFEIGKIAIVPYWEQYEHSKKFIINPGQLFGTGFHESTASCIKEAQNINLKNKKILDIGCGTGILGLISLMLGAENATFIDIEPSAKIIVAENANLNNLTNPTIIVGDILTEPEILEKLQTYDVIFLNIVADVIIKMLPIVKTLMKENAILICAGIIKERKGDVLEAMEKESFKIVNVTGIENDNIKSIEDNPNINISHGANGEWVGISAKLSNI